MADAKSSMLPSFITSSGGTRTKSHLLYCSSVNDPVSCVFIDPKGQFVCWGNTSGAVRVCFPKAQSTAEANALPYSIVVLLRRGEEGIRSIFVDDRDYLYATVGDLQLKVWDLRNLQFDTPITLGAKHLTVDFTRHHSYSLCSNSYTLQYKKHILVVAAGSQFSHVLKINNKQEDHVQVAEQPATPYDTAEIHQHTQFQQFQYSFGMPRGAYPCSFHGQYVSWMVSPNRNLWNLYVMDWLKKEQVLKLSYPVSMKSGSVPSGFKIVGDFLVSVQKRTQVEVRSIQSNTAIQVFKSHKAPIVALAVVSEPSTDQQDEDQHPPIIASIGKDQRLNVWKNFRLHRSLILGKQATRFAIGLPYHLALSSADGVIYYTDDSGVHVVEANS